MPDRVRIAGCRYKPRSRVRLFARLGWFCAIGLAAALGLGAGGCSFQLGSIQDPGDVKTGGITPAASRPSPKTASETDLAYAKAAASELFGRGRKDASASWENPHTGARGTVTPIASEYDKDGTTCHDFLASHVQGGKEAWYRGGACRQARGWDVRDLRPLQRT
jgi:hypothetical protein